MEHMLPLQLEHVLYLQLELMLPFYLYAISSWIHMVSMRPEH
jgi:hypothetical protein